MKPEYKKFYYRYVMNHIFRYTQPECLPPYDDFEQDFGDASKGASACFDYAKYRANSGGLGDPEIVKCVTGISPWSCPEMTWDTMVDSFEGYPFPDRSNTACF